MPNLNSSESAPPAPVPQNGETAFFQPEDPSPNGESGEVKIYLVNHAQGDSNYYKRLGFYCALDTVQNPNAKFLDLLSEQKDFIKERRAGVQMYYFAKEERYNQRIDDTKLKIGDEKVKLLGHVSELSEAVLILHQQEQDLSTLEENLSESMVLLGKRKENLISDATHAVRHHMEELIENYRKVYEDRYSISERTYQDNLPALEIKVEKFKQLREVAENQWGRIVQIMQGLRLDGVNPFLARWLFVLGLGIATVCGAYFFSIFTLSKGLNDENVTFFLLSSLQNFIENLFLPGTSIGGQFAILFGCLSAIIILITAIAFWCWKLLGKFEPANSATTPKADQRISFEADEEAKISLEFTTRSGNFYQFWLQVIPIIIITGIVLITVFLGLSNSPSMDGDILKRLDISLTGATIGALLTLMFAGISFLYIIKVVEPRAENRSGNPNVYLNNIELFITALIFVITTFSLFGLENGGNHQVILFEYIALVLSNGFLLGYALRLKGLFSSLGFLERKILMLTNAIRDNARPRPLNFTAKEDQVFRREYFRLQRELFHLMLLKTQLGNTALGGGNANETRKKASHWWKIARKKTADSNKEADAPAEMDILADWEARLYPENHAVIREMADKLKRARAKVQETSERVNMLKEGRTPYCDVLKDNIRRLEDSLDATKRELEKILFNKSRDFTALHILSDTIQADIREGFNLGMWFRSEVGPGDPPNGYYGNTDYEVIENKFSVPRYPIAGVSQNGHSENLKSPENE